MQPSLTIRVRMSRHRQTLSDQLVLGLLTGGLLGPGLLIEARDSDSIRFRKLGGPLRAAPDRGELLIATTASGDTQIDCRLWCWGLAVRRLLSALLLSAGIGGLCLAGLSVTGQAGGWLWSGLTALLGFGVTFGVGRWFDRARMRRQVEAFIHNTSYVKAV